MYINTVKSVGAVNYYLCESYRTATGHSGSRVVEKLGNADEIRRRFNLDEQTDVKLWCKQYAKEKTLEAKQLALRNNRTISIELSEGAPKKEKSSIFNAGYLILDSVYHSFGLANICEEIKLKHPHIKGFNLNNVLRAMLFGRIINPSSKLKLADCIANRFLEKHDIEVQHIYRAMDLLKQHSELIQKKLFAYTSQALKERNVSRIYYDCTNFFTEKELEDCDIREKSEQWYQEHTLRKYGKSKEHRPNPIEQMGLFMDGDGLPLGFCINPGNTNEQITMKPLEQELLKNFQTSDVIVCTDAGLASYENRRYNNITEEDVLVQYGLRGKRNFICVQSIKGLNSTLKEWALDHKGWSYIRKQGNKSEKVTGFDLDILSEENYSQYYDVLFYKERTIAENNLDQRLIMSFSLKYMDYQRKLRERKILRAQKMIDNCTFNREQDTSPKSLIEKVHTTTKGDVATKTRAFINQDKVDSDAEYDGFYCTATNLFKEECSIEEIVAMSQRRWEIEECFRIMKTELKSRPFYHNKDSRIAAHFQTCYMALLLIRGVERKIAQNNPENLRYPNGKYTVPQILDAIRNINMISVADGRAYMPDYDNSELISELLKIFDLEAFNREIVMKDNLKKILKKIMTSPEMIKN